MKSVLVTGAGGFIGSFLVEEGLKKDWTVWAGVRKTTSKEFLQDSRIQFVDLNFSRKEILLQQIKEHVGVHGKWDFIIHNLGATKCLDPLQFDTINYTYVHHFVEALREADAVPEKFVLMSSLSADVSEEEQSRYGQSKMKAERYLSEQKDIPYLVFRPTGVYGPREKDYLLILKTIKKGLDVAAGLKTQLLSFIYVKDLVRVIYTALESPKINKTYQVSDGQVYTDDQYTRLAKEALGKKHVLKLRIPLPLIQCISALAEDISKITKQTSTLNRDKYRIMKRRDWTCDIRSLREDFSFEPEYDLPKGLQESIAWYRENGWL